MPAYLKARARLLWLGVALGLLGPLPAAVAADASKTEAADSTAEAATPAAAPTTAPGEAPPTDLDSLRACLGENLPAQSLVQNVRLIASDSAGGRELKARVYGMKLDSETAVMIDVRAPSDMSGSRYLVIAGPERDAMYLYIPALNRTRRVVGSMAGQSLWGTDFSYEDIKLLRGLLNQGVLEVETGHEYEKRPALKVRIDPTEEGAESQYSQVTLLVDQQTCVIVEGRFADEAGLAKTLRVAPEDLIEVDGRWWAQRVQVESHRRNSRSELIVDDFEFDRELRARLFDPRSFQRGS